MKMITKTAGISEIFSSLQGEGTHFGERHLFIRFERCNIHCEYCDELDKPGTELNVEAILEEVKRLEREEGPHSFISLTGGEPLFYLPFLNLLIPELRRLGFKLYLETSGILWKPLREVIGWVDVVAMDMKPASVTKEKNFFKEHRKFLEIARWREVFIKMVISKEIDAEEFRELCMIVKEIDPKIPLLLQPISAGDFEGHDDPELMELLRKLQRLAMAGESLANVRIVPRLHKILKIR